MAERVSVLTPEGQFGTVDSVDADAVTRAGGKVLSKKEVAAHELQEAYDKKSAAQKIGGVLSPALPLPAQMALRGSGAIALPPELEAYRAGASQSLTGGAEAILTKEGVELAAGKQAAHAFGQSQLQLKEAHEGLYRGGEVAGFVGAAVMGGAGAGLGRAGAAAPGVGVSMAGNLAERGAAHLLAPVAAKGAIGRALATGGQLATRGAVEGAMYAGASQVTEDMLGDHQVAADKVFASMGTGALYGGAGGFLLGGAGSLAASGVKGAAGAARSSLGRALAKGEAEAGALAGKEAAEGGARAAEGAAVKAESAAVTASPLEAGLGNLEHATRKGANSLAFDSLGSTKSVASKIAKEVDGGVHAVGDYVNRRILKTADAETGFLSTVRGGRADELLPLISADRAVIASEIGAVVKASPVRVGVDELRASSDRIAKAMSIDPNKIQGVGAFQQRIDQTFEAFRNGSKVGPDGSVDLAEMYYARASMEGVAREVKRGNNAAGDAFQHWLRDVDGMLVNKLDEAATALGNPGQKEKLMGFKREYQLASWAEKAAEDGAERIAGNNIFGLREGIGAATALASGNVLGAIGTALGGKVLRERGAAAGAYLLTRMADMGAMTKAIRAMDDQVGRASKGLLAPPRRIPLPDTKAASGSARARAQQSMDRVAEIQANPEAFADHVARATEGMSGTAPNVSSAVAQRMTSAAAFLASKMPVKVDKDPFDPHPAPRLSDGQAASFNRYVHYTEQPSRFFADLEHGKLTYEGVEVARTLMPGAFAELQQRTVEGLAELMAQGRRPPFAQRERLGILLDVPATPSQRPDHMKLLQQNVANTEQAKKASNGATAPRRPLPTKNQPGTLDRLEGR